MAIFVIGYMACGKTTFGRALAKALGRDFIDLDFYIEQRFHASIRDIFANRGEDAFRQMEKNMLREVGEIENVVIACGGGTPCFNSNMDYMLAVGRVIFLEASPQRIVQRLIINRSRRPLLADVPEEELLAQVNDGLSSREQYYSRAHIHFNGNQLENRHQIDNTISEFLSQYDI